MIFRQRTQSVLIGLSATLLTIGLTPVPAHALPQREPGATEQPRVELVLDVSGSMRATDINGRSRIAVAQQAFNDVVDALPEDTQLGIRVLGATYPGNDKAVGCRDTQQLVPVAPVDRPKAKEAIATLRPTGFTPVGLALRGAAQDLGTGATTRRIVLITDGEDTCAPPDPCDVARELAAQGIHLIIDTLGLTQDEKVRKQLVCIAEATGGSYTAVQSQAQLSERINQLMRRAKDTYTKAPTLVGGARRCADAPVLSPGVYTDRELISEHRWYRVPVSPGQELRASVSIALDRRLNPDYGVLLLATADDGRELVRGTDAGSGRADVLSTGLRWSAPDDSSTEDDNDTDDSADAPAARTVCLVVSNSFATPDGANRAPGMPLELTVDLVASSDSPHGPDLGRGWILLLVLVLAGLVTGVVTGWLTRWWVAVWRTN